MGFDLEILRGENRKRGERSVDVEKRESAVLRIALGPLYLICFSGLMVYGDGGSSFPKAFGLNIRRSRKLGPIGLDERSF